MRYHFFALSITFVLTIIQIAWMGTYPFALITYAAWIWWRGEKEVVLWVVLSAWIVGMYTSSLMRLLIIWIATLAVNSLLIRKVLTNRSLVALMAVMIVALSISTSLQWVLTYGISWLSPWVPRLTWRYDIHIGAILASIAWTILYSIALWAAAGKRLQGKRAFLVGGQVV